MRVKCDVEYTTTDNEDGIEVDCTVVTCSRCDQETESYGDSEASVKRCLVLLREDCPMGESNFYITDEV